MTGSVTLACMQFSVWHVNHITMCVCIIYQSMQAMQGVFCFMVVVVMGILPPVHMHDVRPGDQPSTQCDRLGYQVKSGCVGDTLGGLLYDLAMAIGCASPVVNIDWTKDANSSLDHSTCVGPV
jgi:hypothetical protein